MSQHTILRGTSRADVIAIAPIMLGFHPEESVVVLAIRGKDVKFCARLDPDPPGGHRGLLEVRAAQATVHGCQFVLVGFSAEPAALCLAVQQVRRELGDDVLDALVTNGQRFWDVPVHGPLTGPGYEYEYRDSALAAQAVYQGLLVARSRADVVAEVQGPPAHERPGIAERLDDAQDRLGWLGEDEQVALLQERLEADRPLSAEEAAELVCLLTVPDLVGEVLARLGRDNAQRFRDRLVEARRNADGEAVTNVLGLLGLACWLAGEGAQQTECMTQLHDLSPRHLLLGILEALHRGGVPPTEWDRWLRGQEAEGH